MPQTQPAREKYSRSCLIWGFFRFVIVFCFIIWQIEQSLLSRRSVGSESSPQKLFRPLFTRFFEAGTDYAPYMQDIRLQATNPCSISVSDAPPTCNATNYSILVGIFSISSGYNRRKLIRKTIERHPNPRVHFVFVMGEPKDEMEMDEISEENTVWQDLMIIPKLAENMNQGKTFFFLKAVANAFLCSRGALIRFDFVFKMDDDTLINSEALVDFMEKVPCSNVYIGRPYLHSVANNWYRPHYWYTVLRNFVFLSPGRVSWFFSVDEFFLGMAYGLSRDLVLRVVNLSPDIDGDEDVRTGTWMAALNATWMRANPSQWHDPPGLSWADPPWEDPIAMVMLSLGLVPPWPHTYTAESVFVHNLKTADQYLEAFEATTLKHAETESAHGRLSAIRNPASEPLQEAKTGLPQAKALAASKPALR